MGARAGASRTMDARASRIRPTIPITAISPRTALIVHGDSRDHNGRSDDHLGGTGGRLD